MVDMPVEIVDYDPAWLNSFAEQRDRLSTIMKRWLAGPIEHVGSTAVPGLAAKPVVDLLAPVRSLTDARVAVPLLEADGWLHWPDDPSGSWRLWFLRPRPDIRTHHLYLVGYDDPHARELRAFRDVLRTDDALRTAYATLKRQLANDFREHRNAYTNAKSDFVERALRLRRGRAGGEATAARGTTTSEVIAGAHRTWSAQVPNIASI